MKLKKKSKATLQVAANDKQNGLLSDTLQDLFATANRFFVGNTDRRQGERTATGGFTIEEYMFRRGFATAWESFKFPNRMEKVDVGDAICMFAEGIGIIGIGIARANAKR